MTNSALPLELIDRNSVQYIKSVAPALNDRIRDLVDLESEPFNLRVVCGTCCLVTLGEKLAKMLIDVVDILPSDCKLAVDHLLCVGVLSGMVVTHLGELKMADVQGQETGRSGIAESRMYGYIRLLS